MVYVSFKNSIIIFNACTQVSNGYLAVTMYCTNLLLLQDFTANNIVKAASFAAFWEAINFLVNPYYQVLVYRKSGNFHV